MSDPFPVPVPVAYDEQLAARIIQVGTFPADMEALKPRPLSRVPGPGGQAQYETAAEFTRRLVSAAVTHLLKTGLLVIADDAEDRFEAGVPLEFR